VVRTRVGYAGGTTKGPTYENLGDHSETVQIDYDPTRITYAQLLDVFWSSHNPCQRAERRQYQSFIFYHNEEQKTLALASRDRAMTRQSDKVLTEIVPFSRFHLAEGYHQKYMLLLDVGLLRELRVRYPTISDLINSTTAARVNGYLGGNGSAEVLEKEIDSYGLSAAACKRLRQQVAQGRP
jgi:methionine-S-sulfoxide reductase